MGKTSSIDGEKYRPTKTHWRTEMAESLQWLNTVGLSAQAGVHALAEAMLE